MRFIAFSPSSARPELYAMGGIQPGQTPNQPVPHEVPFGTGWRPYLRDGLTAGLTRHDETYNYVTGQAGTACCCLSRPYIEEIGTGNIGTG